MHRAPSFNLLSFYMMSTPKNRRNHEEHNEKPPSNDLNVYVLRAKQRKKVPRTVEKLVVNAGVPTLPERIFYKYSCLREVSLPIGLKVIGEMAFCLCEQLLEIRISTSVECIHDQAFRSCPRLTKVEFESPTSTSPHQLRTIGDRAFISCICLPRFEFPSSMTSIGRAAFSCCSALIEANLSTTSVKEISTYAFYNCASLQTLSLPNTMEAILDQAFNNCSQLVTVLLPLDAKALAIGHEFAFGNCSLLANLVLPKGSTAGGNSFDGSTLLKERFGEEADGIVAGLVERFENFPVHKMCYNHSTVTGQALRQCITEQQENCSLIDKFGMTPLHAFFSTVEPREELLDVLLDSLPHQILKWKDANDRRPLDYLMNNWTDGTANLVHSTFQKSMIDQLARWGHTSWMGAIQRKVHQILAEVGTEERSKLCKEVYSAMEHFENTEITSILEMALWKSTLRSGWSTYGSKRQALDREECCCLSGSNVVIPNVLLFLNVPRT